MCVWGCVSEEREEERERDKESEREEGRRRALEPTNQRESALV